MNFYLKAFVLILAMSLLSFGIHTFAEQSPAFNLIKLYSFLGVATLLSVCAMYYLYDLVPNQLGYAFLVTVFVKFGVALILFPQLLSDEPSLSKTQILSFLIPYFIFLAVEAFMVIKWLNDTPLEAPKD
ncbi:hypothetical protein LX97_01141 [Nonlabens dokdonensis]|jgi:hypothetical protein|uniref:Uncharacterized protein n=2 Tax=Nonlabens dokdonensis TaxID=328515 RepID=L7W8D6_NONDD|nr:DUF6168 family protein [Nonlabens dokdonensis]AGC76477.1 hypothetical protein DDD_1350 [Nonlabens dokdonensis DSW-6]PZX44132.1 hypothetical protein LX97_01141 [Nonlabens dokdonensis]